jgi:hypothetical protein
MPSPSVDLKYRLIKRSCPVACKHVQKPFPSLARYVELIGAFISGVDTFWFRGNPESNRSLTPAALRPKTVAERQAALDLISDFKRIAEAKLARLPDAHDDFKWAQIAQHYGLPTRLLDWTESATTALYFACLKPEFDGIVFMMKPAWA